MNAHMSMPLENAFSVSAHVFSECMRFLCVHVCVHACLVYECMCLSVCVCIPVVLTY